MYTGFEIYTDEELLAVTWVERGDNPLIAELLKRYEDLLDKAYEDGYGDDPGRQSEIRYS